jgi:hypothetical protein
MSIVTLGIYFLYWTYKTFAEIRRWRGQGVNGVVGLLLSFIPVAVFLLPSYIGRLYKEDRIAKGQDPVAAGQNIPITGWTGFLNLIPMIGSIIWVAKVQSNLNNFWEAQGLAAVASVPQPA